MFTFLAPPELPDEIGRLGGYRILRVIGEGGMGVVFEAEDPQLHRRVAIKVLKPQGLEDSTRERFLQEARLAASLNSPRIVTIHQIGEDRGCPFIVMELLHGESLDALLKRRHTLPVSEALRITREVAEGLALAHDNGLIHRDIKPANIWLEKPHSANDTPHVKLLDFGIARLMESDSRLTDEGRIVGTPSYLCPGTGLQRAARRAQRSVFARLRAVCHAGGQLAVRAQQYDACRFEPWSTTIRGRCPTNCPRRSWRWSNVC